MEQLLKTAPSVECVVLYDIDDPETLAVVRLLPVAYHVVTALPVPAKWNIGASIATGDALVLGSAKFALP